MVWEDFEQAIFQNKNHPAFFGIGEIGLDRLKGIPLSEQIKILKRILQFASQEKIARIIIHCVRSYDELFLVLKESHYQGQIILHDYNGNLEITDKLLKLNTYFSFGANLLKEKSKAQKIISGLPPERIFFESDEKDSPEEAYSKAKEITGLDFSAICDKNFQNLF